MIIGVGSDITNIRRIESALSRFKSRFECRIFTDNEQYKARSRSELSGVHNNVAAAYAKRFAAKEACAKALGIGFSGGVTYRNIEVVSSPEGKPLLHLYAAAADRLKSITPYDMTPVLHLSLSDEYPLAMAYVIIEALPCDVRG